MVKLNGSAGEIMQRIDGKENDCRADYRTGNRILRPPACKPMCWHFWTSPSQQGWVKP
jgi:hypothetical protein